MRGHHALRYSFISSLAYEGVDQRIINEILGHESEQQRKRYRHLYPGIMKVAINRAFWVEKVCCLSFSRRGYWLLRCHSRSQIFNEFAEDDVMMGPNDPQFSPDAAMFFRAWEEMPTIPGKVGTLHLLGRDLMVCLGMDPANIKGGIVKEPILWPAAMLAMAGIDLLGKFYAGNDGSGVGDRFQKFVEDFFPYLSTDDQVSIYHLRNSLLHSFGLYSKGGGKEYYFELCVTKGNVMVNRRPGDIYEIDLNLLFGRFNHAVMAYMTRLNSDPALQTNFTAMFPKYGSVMIHGSPISSPSIATSAVRPIP